MNESHALVFAIAHEVGNHLGAIRLQAHLLDDDLDARALALASVELDTLAGRAGPLLALIRPLLSSPGTTPPSTPSSVVSGPMWRGLLGGVIDEIRDEGTRGIRLESKMSVASDLRAPSADWLHSLLRTLIGVTLPHVPRGGKLGLALEAHGDEVVLAIEDDGPEEDLGAETALRGRALAVAIARRLLADLGGRVEWARDAGRTRLELIFPGADPAAARA
ncbi:MAG TPA: sensor histidine kinase [Deltaproteobacteria bacterium]|nr:sensor histidine kinase [Deltaproteobacteria bacterium]